MRSRPHPVAGVASAGSAEADAVADAGPAGAAAERTPVVHVVGLWLASRVAVIACGAVLVEYLGWHRVLESWQRQPWTAVTGWDTEYYVWISHNGYEPGLSVAFFPLYPLAIGAFRWLTGLDDALAALAVANLSMLIGMAGLYVLARDRLSPAHARRALLYLVLSPYAFALVLAYSEGVFLALVAWLFVLSDRRRDGWAIPLAFAAGLTRVTGLALVPPLAVIAWRRRTPAAIALALAPAAGFAAHAAWLAHAVGDPLAMVHVQSEWGGEPSFPLLAVFDHAWRFVQTLDAFYLIRVLTLVAYLALLVPLLRRPVFAAHRLEDALFVAAVFAMPLLSGVLLSVGRFGLLAFPLFFALADLGLRRPAVHQAYLVYAPVAQFLLFASAALGYRPP
jgi:hypothetical protein